MLLLILFAIFAVATLMALGGFVVFVVWVANLVSYRSRQQATKTGVIQDTHIPQALSAAFPSMLVDAGVAPNRKGDDYDLD